MRISDWSSDVCSSDLGLQQDLRQEGRPVLGGPDDAFEIYTDPQTGERSYKPVKEFVEYNENKRTKQKDVADINGRIMYAIRSAERRVGEVCVRTCRARWSRYYSQQNI